MSRRGKTRREWDEGAAGDEAAYRERTRDIRNPRRNRRAERTDRPAAAKSVAQPFGGRPAVSDDDSGRPPRQFEHANGLVALTMESVKSCGSCRNWLPDGMPGGRGTCDHPGSGFLNPYGDTPACPFHDR